MTKQKQIEEILVQERIDAIHAKLKAKNVPFFANDTIYNHLSKDDLRFLERELAVRIRKVLDCLIIDPTDHNTKETPERVAKMYMHEVMRGRYHKPASIKTFPNVKETKGLQIVGPITVRSMCSHHLVPIVGECYIGTVGPKDLLGLSKFNRIVYDIAQRPQIQEEMVKQISDAVMHYAKPEGSIVFVKAQHMCGTWRGVQDNSEMINSEVTGSIADNPAIRDEFFNLVRGR